MINKTLFAALIACAAALAAACPALAAEELLAITSNETCLYTEPGRGWTDNRLNRNTLVALTGPMEDGWYPVRMRNGEEGWVAGWVAEKLPQKTELPAAFTEDDIPTLKSPLYAKVIADHVSFRTIPYGGLNSKLDFTRTGFVPGGIVLKITDRFKHWMKAQLTPTVTGWVYDEALTPVKPPAGNTKYGVPVSKLDRMFFSRTGTGNVLYAKLSKPVTFEYNSNTAPDMVSFKLYGVDCDRLRWRWNSPCRAAGGWCACHDGTETLSGMIGLKHEFAGYETGYTEDGYFYVRLRDPAKAPIRKIVLDAGHGAPEPWPPGYAEGAHGPGDCMEHAFNMNVTRMTAALLREQGFQVLLTRDGESEGMMDLYNRVRLSDREQADLFISIHANGDLDPEVSGVEIYWYDPMNRPLAEILAAEIPAATGRESGIAIFGSFAVIRQTRVPSVLIEAGYLTNPGEGKLLCSEDFQEETAAGIARGILRYIASVE